MPVRVKNFGAGVGENFDRHRTFLEIFGPQNFFQKICSFHRIKNLDTKYQAIIYVASSFEAGSVHLSYFLPSLNRQKCKKIFLFHR